MVLKGQHFSLRSESKLLLRTRTGPGIFHSAEWSLGPSWGGVWITGDTSRRVSGTESGGDGDLGLQVFLREPGIWEKCLREGEETWGASEAGILDPR